MKVGEAQFVLVVRLVVREEVTLDVVDLPPEVAAVVNKAEGPAVVVALKKKKSPMGRPCPCSMRSSPRRCS